MKSVIHKISKIFNTAQLSLLVSALLIVTLATINLVIINQKRTIQAQYSPAPQTNNGQPKLIAQHIVTPTLYCIGSPDGCGTPIPTNTMILPTAYPTYTLGASNPSPTSIPQTPAPYPNITPVPTLDCIPYPGDGETTVNHARNMNETHPQKEPHLPNFFERITNSLLRILESILAFLGRLLPIAIPNPLPITAPSPTAQPIPVIITEPTIPMDPADSPIPVQSPVVTDPASSPGITQTPPIGILPYCPTGTPPMPTPIAATGPAASPTIFNPTPAIPKIQATTPSSTSGRITKDGLRFVKNGQTFYPITDTAWLLYKLNANDLDFYLKTRACQGFNSITFDLYEVRETVNDRIFDKLKQYGLVAVPLVHANQVNEGLANVERYKNRDILGWVVAGLDANEAPESKVADMMKKVRAKDPKNLLTAHADQGKSTSQFRLVNPLTDFHYVHNCCQQPGGNLTKNLVINDLEKKDKPVYVGEAPYEGPRITSTNVMNDLNNFYSANPSGITYGHDAVWSFCTPPDQDCGPLWTGHTITTPWKTVLNTDVVKRITQIAKEKNDFSPPAFCSD